MIEYGFHVLRFVSRRKLADSAGVWSVKDGMLIRRKIESRDKEKTVRVEQLSNPRRQPIITTPVSFMALIAVARVLQRRAVAS